MTDARINEIFEKCGRKMSPDMRVYHDTSAFMDLDAGDLMILNDEPYLISRNEKESGFGMDDDPKYWVKRTIDLKTGKTKIIKLVFFEEFWQKMGGLDVRFFRSPEKEAEVLDLVEDHPFFMNGAWTTDVAANNVRIIDFIRGPSLLQMISRIDRSPENYFRQDVTKILTDLVPCLDSLSYLHNNNLVHGDVRWDHILWDRESKRFRWIDFDYDYNFPENPFGADIFGIGKILANIIGQGPKYFHDIKNNHNYRDIIDHLVPEDFSIVEGNRLMNLKKIYPFIPDSLNNILLFFSGHADVYYESITEVTNDLRRVLMGEFYSSLQGRSHDEQAN
jgi:hypothetical protein